MNLNRQTIIGVATVLAIVLGAIGFSYWYSNTPGKLDLFATCLKDRGVIFYGAFWCPHCQNQKALFGKSEKLLPYTECSTPDGKEQLELCRLENIESYPTWVFPDGSRQSGELSLETLSEKSGCALSGSL